jgi:hypothetical protein
MESTAIWVTRNGRQLPVTSIDDDHLQNIVEMGMRSIARHFMNEGLDCLAGAAGGDDGLQYFAEVQCDEQMARASNPREMLRLLARTRRYGAVVREAQARAKRRSASRIRSSAAA